jgi:voltage-gated potassium channel Kch
MFVTIPQILRKSRPENHIGRLMSKTPTLKDRLRYNFDKSMAAGAPALVGWLALISFIVILVAALVLATTGIAPTGSENLGFIEALWESLMRTIDAGTVGGDQGWSFRGVMFIVTAAGIFIFSALIGVLSAGIEGKLSELRKGRSRVIESDHTIIYNWSPSIFDILGELAVANQSVRKARVVIMADKDKVEMEDEIAAKAPPLGRMKVICRSGDPTDLQDMQITNPQACRSAIILSPDSENPDAAVIKTIVALVNDPDRRATPYRIAAEIRDEKNVGIARAVGRGQAQLILADDLISRIMVHSSRESGLSAVYTELLDFDGSEIYVLPQPNLTGLCFGAGLLAYDHCVLIGICDAQGVVQVHPPMDRVFKADDMAVLIAEDDSAIVARVILAEPETDLITTPAEHPHLQENGLILGWNRRGPMIVREMSRLVAAGSTLTIAADSQWLPEVADLPLDGENLAVTIKRIETTQAADLNALHIAGFDHVLVLGYSDDLPAQTADTHTLVTLLQLRQIADAQALQIKVVSEMIDVRNRKLAEVTRADDFVVSNKLVSLMLAQASENQHITAIFDDLLDAAGSEIHTKPISDFVQLGAEVDFITLTHAARMIGYVAIGMALADGSVQVNPVKAARRSYGAADRLVVLSRD